ncbi:MAG TPA: acetyl-CoA C-acyltransferase, partial [Phaeodactylibacter sp.]|nr:acetyl-CoA C-acyltransferase [Phaeodactylibacter sp.]
MDAYIIKAYRTAVGKAKKGSFRHTRPDDLAVKVIQHIMSEVPDIAPEMVDDVIVGCANPEGEQGLQIGRWVAVQALGITVPGMTVNRYCASGLETISLAVAKIQAGMGHVFLAGGLESMSMIPMTGYKFAPNYNIVANTPEYMASMGITSEMVAKKYEITREQCDAFALRSHQRAAAAIDAGKFKDEIVPVEVTEVFVEGDRRQ